MLQINLQKELAKQSKTSKESKKIQLEIDQYLKLIQQGVSEESLNKVGFGHTFRMRGKIVEDRRLLLERLSTLPKDRVFHKTQIKSLCEKYSLRFLPTYRYKGEFPEDLDVAIYQAEQNVGKLYESGCYVAAPKSSFELEEKPKDPLLFFSLGDDYYYLIHKWGKDLSIFRRLVGLWNMNRFAILSTLFLSIGWFSGFMIAHSQGDTSVSGNVLAIGLLGTLIGFCIFMVVMLVVGMYSLITNSRFDLENFFDKHDYESRHR